MEVKPFKAIRPSREVVSLVPTRSYLEYTEKDLRDKLQNNPFTYLHVINPDFHLGTPLKGIEKMHRVKAAFEDFCEKGIFVPDTMEGFYLYQQVTPSGTFTGIIGAAAVKDYLEGKIKKHENTLSAREELFKEYLQITGINAEPVLLIHEKNQTLEDLFSEVMNHRPEYEFTTTDRAIHYFWPIHDADQLHRVESAFAGIDSLYIADGHHRCASTSLLGSELSNPTETKASDYFLAFFLSEDSVKINEFNRVVKGLNGLSADAFLEKLSQQFEVTNHGVHPFKPEAPHHIGMYLEDQWYCLRPKAEIISSADPVKSLDYEILSEFILSPILEIHDLKTDQRVSFLPGTDGVDAVVEKVNWGTYSVGFVLPPVAMDQLKAVADANLVMPPKSTYIEPKMRSGLTIYKIVEE